MSKVRSRLLVAGLFCFFACYLQPRANAIVEPTPADVALPVPEVFAPGIISGPANDGSPTFSPDGGTLFSLEVARTGPSSSNRIGSRMGGPSLRSHRSPGYGPIRLLRSLRMVRFLCLFQCGRSRRIRRRVKAAQIWRLISGGLTASGRVGARRCSFLNRLTLFNGSFGLVLRRTEAFISLLL